MEKFNWFEQILDKWTNLSDKKRITYITGAIIIALTLIIYFGYVHYEKKITKLENEKVALKNEYTISLNGIISRYDAIIATKEENERAALEAHIKYVEKNEEQIRDILFYTKKYKKGK